jgi:hypothetical protein
MLTAMTLRPAAVDGAVGKALYKGGVRQAGVDAPLAPSADYLTVDLVDTCDKKALEARLRRVIDHYRGLP